MPTPDINSNYYIMTSYGGWSPCIQGNTAHGLLPFPGSVIPNCTGFATGRYNERLNLGACTYLGSANGGDFIDQFAFSQGLEVSIEPVIGGAMVWKNSGEGHVAIVEAIIDPDTIQTSESGWDWTTNAWEYRTHYRNGGRWHWNSDYRYQGCICPPGVPGDLISIVSNMMGFFINEED